MTTVSDLVDRVLTQLYEATDSPIHWSRDEITHAINEAVGVIHRAGLNSQTNADVLDSFYVTKSVSLDAGTKQTLPASGAEKGAQFVMVHSVNNRAVTSFSPRAMDAVKPSWVTSTGQQPRQFARDRDVRIFWVYPGARSGDTAEIAYIREPEALAEGDAAPFESKYDQALIDFALYRAYSKDTEYAGQDGRAAAHYSAFRDGVFNGAG